MSKIQNNNDEILRLPSGICQELEKLVEYMNNRYCFKIELQENMEVIKKENIIVISMEKENFYEIFTYEIRINNENFKELSSIFNIFDSIEQVYNYIKTMYNENNI